MNSRRMNRLEELGRVDAEKADTRKGKRNLREEKSRIVRELKADGGKVKNLPGTPSPKRRRQGPKRQGPKPRRQEEQRKMRPGPRNKKRNPFPDLKRAKTKNDLKIAISDSPKFKKDGTRAEYKSGGMAKRGRGCEIR